MLHTVVIKENRDFRRIYGRGRSFVSPSLVVYIMKNKTGGNRIGITVGKKIGSAVKRNRAKRIIREGYRSLENRLGTGMDIIFVARKKTVSLKSGDMVRAMTAVFQKAGALRA